MNTQVMNIQKRVLEIEHSDILISMFNLALTYSKQEQWKKTEDLNTQVINIQKRVLRIEHSETLTSMFNLAISYSDQGE